MSAPVTERVRTAGWGPATPGQRGTGQRGGNARRRRGRGGATPSATTQTSRTTATTQTTGTASRATRTAPRPDQSGAPVAGTRGTPRKAKPSGAQRAYARRDERLRRQVAGHPGRDAGPGGWAPFVLLLMGLLGTGLVATLWLSTAAAADSYRLQDARVAARNLSSQSERLHREVASMESAPELARRAAGIGMVPVQDPARLVVAPDSSVRVVGVPLPAVAKAPPVPPAPRQPVPPPPADAASQTPGDQAAQPASGAAGQPASGADPGTATSDPAASDPAATGPTGTDPAATTTTPNGTTPSGTTPSAGGAVASGGNADAAAHPADAGTGTGGAGTPPPLGAPSAGTQPGTG